MQAEYVYVIFVRYCDDRNNGVFRKKTDQLSTVERTILAQTTSNTLGAMVDYAIDREVTEGGYDEDEFRKSFAVFQQRRGVPLDLTFEQVKDAFATGWDHVSPGAHGVGEIIVMKWT